MLISEHSRRSKNCRLSAVHHSLESRTHRDLRFAITNIADDKPVHRRCGFHVGFCVLDGGSLIDGQVVWERIFELVLPRRVGRKGMAANELALGVEF